LTFNHHNIKIKGKAKSAAATPANFWNFPIVLAHGCYISMYFSNTPMPGTSYFLKAIVRGIGSTMTFWKQEGRRKKEEGRSKKQERRKKKQEARSKKQEARSKKQEARSKKQEARSRKQKAKSKKQEARSIEARSQG